jgi:hypothetical protein
MAKKEDAAPEVVDHVEEPDNNPSSTDNAPHGRRVQGVN